MDRRRAAANPADPARSVDFTRQQSELDRRQARGDARQDQIEQAQTGGDDRQDLLDSQQHSSGEPPSSEPATPTELQADLQARGRAAAQRAANARRRAEEALARAEAAERRAQALRDRSPLRP
jgi:peptidoglycan hydrolase CwlO-like protein